MASTSQVIKWYGSDTGITLVKSGTQLKCTWPEGLKSSVEFPADLQRQGPDGTTIQLDSINLTVHRDAVAAMEVVAHLMRHTGVKIKSWASGTINCRCIRNNCSKAGPSIHAVAAAIDVLPDTQPHHDEWGLLCEQVEVLDFNPQDPGDFRLLNWLGPTFDPMHVQLNQPPGYRIDYSSVMGWQQESNMAVLNKLDWKAIQSALNTVGFDVGTVDGIPGEKTEQGLKAFQKSRNLTASGFIKSDSSFMGLSIPDATGWKLMAAAEPPSIHPHEFASKDHTHKTGEPL